MYNTNPHGSEPIRPIAQTDGHDAPGLVGKFVPRVAAMPEDGVVGLEHSVRQPVVAHELPDVLKVVPPGVV